MWLPILSLTSFHSLTPTAIGARKYSRAVQVAHVVGVINATGLNQEVVTIAVVGEEVYGGFGHLQDGRLIVFLPLGEAVIVEAEVASGKQAQNLAITGSRDGDCVHGLKSARQQQSSCRGLMARVEPIQVLRMFQVHIAPEYCSEQQERTAF